MEDSGTTSRVLEIPIRLVVYEGLHRALSSRCSTLQRQLTYLDNEDLRNVSTERQLLYIRPTHAIENRIKKNANQHGAIAEV